MPRSSFLLVFLALLLPSMQMETGLFCQEGRPVPLKGIDAKIDIFDTVAEIAVTQTYINDGTTPIETTYKFPMDDLGAVTGLTVEFENDKLTGKFEEKAKAKEIYDEAVRTGKQASLLEENRPDIFTASIGNIRPKEKVLVTIHYVTQLTLEPPDVVKFIFPATIAPRYTSTSSSPSSSQEVNPVYLPKGQPAPYRLSLRMNATMASEIVSIQAPYHALHTRIDGRMATVELREGSTTLERDVIVHFHVRDAWSPRGLLEFDPKTHTYAMMITGAPYQSSPSAPSPMAPWTFADTPLDTQDIIFVVDRSGSMMGTKMQASVEALVVFLQALQTHVSDHPSGPKIRFNVLSFGSTYSYLFSTGPEAVTKENIERAVAVAREMQADYGGTELIQTLQSIYDSVARADAMSGRRRTDVILLTDGEISGTDEALRAARQAYVKHGLRVFSVGIGSDVSHHLVRSIANVAGGVSEFVQLAKEDRLQKKVLLQLSRALSPSLPLSIDWGTKSQGLSLLGEFPNPTPSCFLDTQYVVYGMAADLKKRGNPLSWQGTVYRRLRTKVAEDEAESTDPTWRRPIAFPSTALLEGRILHRLAARALIRQWEEDSDNPTLHKDQIIRLSLEAGVLSRQTSLILVSDKAPVGQGPPRKVDIPSQVPADYGAGGNTLNFMAAAPPVRRMVPAPQKGVGKAAMDMSAPAAPMAPPMAVPGHAKQEAADSLPPRSVDGPSGGGGNGAFYFILGICAVVIALVGYRYVGRSRRMKERMAHLTR